MSEMAYDGSLVVEWTPTGMQVFQGLIEDGEHKWAVGKPLVTRLEFPPGSLETRRIFTAPAPAEER